MDGRARKFVAANRSLLIGIPICALLLISVSWNIWQYRLERDRQARAKAEERSAKAAVALAREYADRTKLEKRARDAKSGARIQQLYEEINDLTRVSRVITVPDNMTRTARTTQGGANRTAEIR